MLQQIFIRFAPEYIEKFGEHMPLSHRRTLFDIAACRTEAMGGHSEVCCDCGTIRFIPHSCRHPLCVSCHDAEVDDWLAARADELLPAPYFHITFPLPSELRDAARSHYSVVCEAMLQAAAESLQTLAKNNLGGQFGIIEVLHTWGRTLVWHPHVHCLVPGAVVNADGEFRKVKGDYLLPITALSKVYRAIFLRQVRSHRDGPKLPKIEWSKQWVANCRPCPEGPGNVLKYLARYTKRGPLAKKQIISVTNKEIAFRYRSHKTKLSKVCRFTPQEFLRRYLQHTPPKGFHRIRYYGLLAPGNRRKLRALRLMLMVALAVFSPVITELKIRSQMRPDYRCSQCGGRCFVRFDFTSPNRRAPPWQQVT